MRAFIALDLPEPPRAALAAAIERLRGQGDVRWVGAAQLHLTLRFLGEIDDRQRHALAACVQAGPWPALRLQLLGLGQFPPRGAPRVLWAGVAGDLQELDALAARVEVAAVAAGLPPADHPFNAHVTLGRARSPRGALRLSAALAEQGKAFASEPFTPSGPILYASELAPGGPIHTPLARGRFEPA